MDQGRLEGEMGEVNGIEHDGMAGVSVRAGGGRGVRVCFRGGRELLAGRHEPGHYAGAMVPTIRVEG